MPASKWAGRGDWRRLPFLIVFLWVSCKFQLWYPSEYIFSEIKYCSCQESWCGRKNYSRKEHAWKEKRFSVLITLWHANFCMLENSVSSLKMNDLCLMRLIKALLNHCSSQKHKHKRKHPSKTKYKNNDPLHNASISGGALGRDVSSLTPIPDACLGLDEMKRFS